MCHSTVAMPLNELLSLWQRAAIALLGDDRGVIHLTPEEFAPLKTVLDAQGHELEVAAVFDFPLPNRGGIPNLANYWPDDNYLVELDVTSGLYAALVRALRDAWAGQSRQRPSALGKLDRASDLERLWRKEKASNPALAFARCRDLVVGVAQTWRRRADGGQKPKARLARRRPAGLPVCHDYQIIEDRREGRISAYFPSWKLSLPAVRYTPGERAMHDLIVEFHENETEVLTYDDLAKGLGLRVPPSKVSATDRRKTCETIRATISRFNRKWRDSIHRAVEARAEEFPATIRDRLEQQGDPLVRVGSAGAWRIAVPFEVLDAED